MKSRRNFLDQVAAFGLALGALPVTARPLLAQAQGAADDDWDAGEIAHILPGAAERRFLIKLSLLRPATTAPELIVAGRRHPGTMTDTAGLFWQFDVDRLEPGTRYELALVEGRDRPLCDPWPLSTLPSRGETTAAVRVLMFSCAGGHDVMPDLNTPGGLYFLSTAARARMLRRAMSFAPDVVIANGDHVYWDYRTGPDERRGGGPYGGKFAGIFDRSLPILGTANEAVLKRAVGPQVAQLYGTLFRSVPVFFLQDDHDYFEGDDADDEFVSFPPDHFMLNAARTSQRLYYPEFLPDPDRPLGLPTGNAADRPPGISESFGTLRWGRLAEFNLFDCRRHLSLTGPTGHFVPRDIEGWLKARIAGSDAAHVVSVPSTPPGWSAGKWAEWYPDAFDKTSGTLRADKEKPHWQKGWRAQHDRLLEAASARRDRIPLFVSGDLHSIGETRIMRTGDIDLRANPAISVLPGPVSTNVGWPSRRRGLRGIPPHGLEVDETLPALEENGFTLADLTPGKVILRYFKWKQGQPEAALDSLEPFRVTELERPA